MNLSTEEKREIMPVKGAVRLNILKRFSRAPQANLWFFSRKYLVAFFVCNYLFFSLFFLKCFSFCERHLLLVSIGGCLTSP